MAVLKRFKLLVDCGVRKIAADLGRKNQPQIVIKADQSLVEGGVVEAVEADSVADVEALAFVAAPRQDVGGDEELADGKAGDGANPLSAGLGQQVVCSSGGPAAGRRGATVAR